MRLVNVIVFLSFLSFCYVSAGTLMIYNHARYPVHVGLYYVKTNMWGTSVGPAELQGAYCTILPDSQEALNCPGIKFFYNREILFSAREHELLQTLTPDQYIKASRQSTGFYNSTSYHIAEKDGVLQGYGQAEWVVAKPVIEQAEKLAYQFLSHLQKSYSNHPYVRVQAHVTLGGQISPEEQASVGQRLIRVHDTLETMLNAQIPLEKTPAVAVCMSGGGMRAAMCAFALTSALDESGLLDAVTYTSALSGSTWFLTDWIYSGKSLDSYYQDLIGSLSGIHICTPEMVARSLWQKYIFHQDTSLIDVYGTFLGNTFLQHIGNAIDHNAVTFSSLVPRLAGGAYAFPLCTVAETSAEDHWVTCSPTDVSSDTLNF